MSTAAARTSPQAGVAEPRGRAETRRTTAGAAHSVAAALQARAGNRAVTTLLGPGAPLAPPLRVEMEAQFGTGFADVRVHDGERANALAAAVHAHAFARGDDLVFARGRFAPASVRGRHLLAHELAHVVQQRRGGARPAMQRTAPAEAAADRAADQAARGRGPVEVAGASAVGIARAEADDAAPAAVDNSLLNRFRRGLLETITTAAGYAGPGVVLLAKANEGFSDQLFQELWVENGGVAILAKLAETMGYTGPLEAFAGYNVGVVEGMASPITDLFGFAVLAEDVRNFGWSLLSSVYNSGGTLGPEVNALTTAGANLANSAVAALKKFVNDPNSLAQLLALPASLNAQAQQRAYELGRTGASKVVAGLKSPFEPEQADAQAPAFGLTTAFSWAQSKASALHDWVFSTPWSKIGENLGYAVGFVAIQFVLLAMSAGIGELIESAGAAVGRLSAAMARLSSGAASVTARAGDLLIVIGEAISAVEKALAGLAGKAAEGLFKFFGDTIGKGRTFLTKLFELVNKVKAMITGESRGLLEQGGADAAALARRQAAAEARARAQAAAREAMLEEIHAGSTAPSDWPQVDLPEEPLPAPVQLEPDVVGTHPDLTPQERAERMSLRDPDVPPRPPQGYSIEPSEPAPANPAELARAQQEQAELDAKLAQDRRLGRGVNTPPAPPPPPLTAAELREQARLQAMQDEELARYRQRLQDVYPPSERDVAPDEAARWREQVEQLRRAQYGESAPPVPEFDPEDAPDIFTPEQWRTLQRTSRLDPEAVVWPEVTTDPNVPADLPYEGLRLMIEAEMRARGMLP